MLRIGCARTDITVYEPGIGMLGWAYHDNVVRGVAMPLHARAFVLEQPGGGRLALVVAEVCFVTRALRSAVLDEIAARPALGLEPERVVLTATHTHSGPGGYSDTVFYNASIPGFSRHVLDGLTRGIVSALEQACARLTPARARVHAGRLPVSEPVAFNRSIRSYEANADVSDRTGQAHSPTALDREMTILRFDDATGRPLGLVSWFGVHGTSVHRQNTLLHPDNKGVAAAWFERYAAERLGSPDFVAAFAQAPCADVSPNRNYHPRRGMTVGEHEDDYLAAQLNGQIQARFARELFESTPQDAALEPRLDGALLHADFADLAVQPAYADGRADRRTVPAVLGLRMIVGTKEGPGLPYQLAPLVETASRARRLLGAWARGDDDHPHAPKLPLLELGLGRRGRTLGLVPQDRPYPVPDGADPTVGFLNRVLRDDALDERPWAPQVLPAQIVRIGDLAIAATAGELTTVAGRRLRAGLQARLAEGGVTRVVAMPYSNTYAGYITTPEEYACQGYEGGHTLFGRWTLGGHRTLFDRVAGRLLTPVGERGPDQGPQPPRADPALLARWAYIPRGTR